MEKNCTFCQIVRGERPAAIEYHHDAVIVFKDIHPHAPVHLLIVPKKHIRSLNDLVDQDKDLLSEMILAARKVAKEKGIANPGYRLLMNVESGGGQVIFHLHMHLMGGW
jgi:histidine triad (HIT) family protein